MSRFRLAAGIFALAAMAGTALLTGCGGGTTPAQSTTPAEPFTVAKVHFEQNATDSDNEVVFEVKGGAEGLTRLTVVSPAGHTVTDFTARDTVTLGLRQFRFESPEPKDVARLKTGYPEGTYTFTGSTASGARLEGSATLSHELAPTATFVRPEPEAEGVPLKGLVMRWAPVANLSGFIVYIEQEQSGTSFTANLPGSATSLVVPDGFLTPETEYMMGIGTVTQSGNVTFVEATFTTAAK